jgi:hypothetical protein
MKPYISDACRLPAADFDPSPGTISSVRVDACAGCYGAAEAAAITRPSQLALKHSSKRTRLITEELTF